MYALSLRYNRGEIVKLSNRDSMKISEDLAFYGYPQAMAHTGFLYLNYVDGIERDLNLGLKWLEKGASLGSSLSKDYLFDYYYENFDYQNALYSSRLSETGYIEDYINLGFLVGWQKYNYETKQKFFHF